MTDLERALLDIAEVRERLAIAQRFNGSVHARRHCVAFYTAVDRIAWYVLPLGFGIGQITIGALILRERKER